MAKRAREVARQERQNLKRERRQNRANEESGDSPDQSGLMDEFARLSEAFDDNRLDEETYRTERRRILTELGIEVPEEA